MTLDRVLRPRDVDLHVSLEGRQDLCGQIYRQIRAAILLGYGLIPTDRVGEGLRRIHRSFAGPAPSIKP